MAAGGVNAWRNGRFQDQLQEGGFVALAGSGKVDQSNI
jgi:hypothetical protein